MLYADQVNAETLFIVETLIVAQLSITLPLWNPKVVYCRVYGSQPVGTTLNLMDPVHTHCFFKHHFNIILPFALSVF
jgi:hypothetical protein